MSDTKNQKEEKKQIEHELKQALMEDSSQKRTLYIMSDMTPSLAGKIITTMFQLVSENSEGDITILINQVT